MIHQQILLKEHFAALKGSEAAFKTYVIDNSPEIDSVRKRPAIVICPGGGYGFVSDREAEPVALQFVAKDYHVFVLRYSVSPHQYPTQLLEVSATVAYIRRMAEVWHIDTERIVVCGFSAGGHLAGSLGTLWGESCIEETLGITRGENRPNGMLLCYPVITGGTYAHKGSFDNLLGESADETLRTKYSLENCVTKETPPAFIWHTGDDGAVPVENTLCMVQALQKAQVPYELHLYPSGPHGISLASRLTATDTRPDLVNTHIATWLPLASEWIDKYIG